MLAEFIQSIADKAEKAATPKVVGLDDNRAILSVNGTHEFIDLPTRHKNDLGDMDAVKQAMDRYCETFTVWHSDKGGIIILHDDDANGRRDFSRMSLKHTTQLNQLIAWESQDAQGISSMDQRTIVRALNLTLRGCCPEGTVPLLRKLEFRKDSRGHADLQHSKETLGRSVDAEVTGARDIPEMIPMTVPIYESPAPQMIRRIECVLDIDTKNETLRLTPVPGQIEAAITEAQDQLHELLVEMAGNSGRTVLHGRPGHI